VSVRILHISDLHFGKHNSDLAESVKDRAKAIQPDLILATGDLADQPTNKLLIDAKKFLEELKKSCADRPQSDPGRPQLIVIPGNHDVRYWGNLRISDDNYRNTFAGVPVHYYFQLENVWVYGFDSSLEIRTGANGRVAAADLTRFNRLYDDLKEQHKEKFESAFKIVAIHHHPVPIKYDDSVAKWLVLTNAGEFLGEILKRKIDLVLHGHEHIRARARYGRQLRVEGPQEVPIISVGSTLKKNAGERNCFHVIEISNLGTIRVDYYGADLNQFDHAPSEPYEIISAEQAQERTFEGVRKEAGFCYSGLASITKINKDGDALRIVECHDLRVADPSKARASLHIASTSSTSGYVDMPRASAIRGNGLLKLQLTGFQVKTAKAITGEPVEWADFTIDYGRKLARNEVISYSYSWYAVNSFAMNERETRLKYSEPTPLEFTHFTVNDPIEDLAIIVQFPEDFVLPTEGPQPRVIKVDPEGPEPGIEAGLRASNALQYYESLRTASLRVRRPAIGYSYGIQWAVPASPPAPRGPVAGRLDEIINGLLS
jgi:3',5'-cyclic AMP phosphodiesterase CpdA